MSTASSSHQAEVSIDPGEQKEILISQGGSAYTAPAGTARSTLSSASGTEPVAEVTIHMEPQSTEHPSQAHEVKEEAKETMKKGVQSGVKSMAGVLARGGLHLLSKTLQPKKESPKTPLSEEELARRDATFTSAPTTTHEATATHAAPSAATTAKEKVKHQAHQLVGTVTKMAHKMSAGKEAPPGEHSAPVEHTLAIIAHLIHKNSAMIGHGTAKLLRMSQRIVEKDETKRNQILQELAIEKLLYEGDVQSRLPSELTSIEDIDLAVHEITDLIAFKLARIRNKLVAREEFFNQKELMAKRSGHDYIRQAEHALKNRVLGFAKKGAAKMSETVTEKTGVNVIVPELTGTEVVEKLEVVPTTHLASKTSATQQQQQEFFAGSTRAPGFSTAGTTASTTYGGKFSPTGLRAAGSTGAPMRDASATFPTSGTSGAASTLGGTQGMMKQPEFGAEAGKSTTSSQRLPAQ